MIPQGYLIIRATARNRHKEMTEARIHVHVRVIERRAHSRGLATPLTVETDQVNIPSPYHH